MHVSYMPEQMPEGGYAYLMSDLIGQPTIHTGEWQAMNTTGSPAHATHELEDVSLVWERVPADPDDSFPYIDHAWADEHFNERVSGQPMNPAPSHVRWPYAVRNNADHTKCPTCGSPNPAAHPATQAEGEVTHICPDRFHSGLGGTFDHTYPERFWPKYAGQGRPQNPDRIGGWKDPISGIPVLTPPNQEMKGVRFNYGDLSDVVDLLVRSPLTRQAYVPIWFPEDTGAVSGQRVPCTLGYHFMQRGGRLSVRYYLRSCDAYRHLSNDVYFTHRLLHWMCDEVELRSAQNNQPLRFRPGGVVMHISSLHAFVNDKPKIENRILGLRK